MPRRISLHKSALTGFIFATVMCVLRYINEGISLDELAIRFAVYFSIFTLGFWALYNFVGKHTGQQD